MILSEQSHKEREIIKISVLTHGEKYCLETYAGEYRNLMELLRNTLCLENFGECGGMGRCCTCLVKIISSSVLLATLERNEASTLDKHAMLHAGNRLSCQIELDEQLNNTVISL